MVCQRIILHCSILYFSLFLSYQGNCSSQDMGVHWPPLHRLVKEFDIMILQTVYYPKQIFRFYSAHSYATYMSWCSRCKELVLATVRAFFDLIDPETRQVRTNTHMQINIIYFACRSCAATQWSKPKACYISDKHSFKHIICFPSNQCVPISSQTTRRRKCLYWTTTSSDILLGWWEKLRTRPSQP